LTLKENQVAIHAGAQLFLRIRPRRQPKRPRAQGPRPHWNRSCPRQRQYWLATGKARLAGIANGGQGYGKSATWWQPRRESPLLPD